MVTFLGGIPKMLVLCSFLKILMVSDEMIHRAFRTHKQNPLEEILIFTIYQNYTLALRHLQCIVADANLVQLRSSMDIETFFFFLPLMNHTNAIGFSSPHCIHFGWQDQSLTVPGPSLQVQTPSPASEVNFDLSPLTSYQRTPCVLCACNCNYTHMYSFMYILPIATCSMPV